MAHGLPPARRAAAQRRAGRRARPKHLQPPRNLLVRRGGRPCDGSDHAPACWLTVSFDTSYGYSDERGYGCGDLHAEYIARLGQWLDAMGIRWCWENEFTGEIHTGYEQLTGLASGAFEASAWFRTTVLPAIETHARRS